MTRKAEKHREFKSLSDPPVKLSLKRSGSLETLELDGKRYLDLTEGEQTDLAYWRISHGQDTVCQNQQNDIVGVYQHEQARVVWNGHCRNGCSVNNLISGMPCPLASEQRRLSTGRRSGEKVICQYTRMPCPSHQLREIVERYGSINA